MKWLMFIVEVLRLIPRRKELTELDKRCNALDRVVTPLEKECDEVQDEIGKAIDTGNDDKLTALDNRLQELDKQVRFAYACFGKDIYTAHRYSDRQA